MRIIVFVIFIVVFSGCIEKIRYEVDAFRRSSVGGGIDLEKSIESKNLSSGEDVLYDDDEDIVIFSDNVSLSRLENCDVGGRYYFSLVSDVNCSCPVGFGFDISETVSSSCPDSPTGLNESCLGYYLRCVEKDEVCLANSCLALDPMCRQLSMKEDGFQCLMVSALASRDVLVCNVMSENYQKEVCIGNVAALEGNVSFCDLIKSDQKQVCISKVAVSNRDLFLCDELSGKYLNLCIRNVAYSLLDETKCLSIEDVDVRDDCLRFIARKSVNPDVCKLLTEYDSQDACLSDLAVSNLLPDVCDMIEGDDVNDECQYFFAKLLKQYVFCPKIHDDLLRDKCEYLFL